MANIYNQIKVNNFKRRDTDKKLQLESETLERIFCNRGNETEQRIESDSLKRKVWGKVCRKRKRKNDKNRDE